MRMQEQNEGRKGGFIADEMGYVLPAASESKLLTGSHQDWQDSTGNCADSRVQEGAVE